MPKREIAKERLRRSAVKTNKFALDRSATATRKLTALGGSFFNFTSRHFGGKLSIRLQCHFLQS
jgi:hypothetical protein